jgi:DNA-binding GntR family transcriptional regulator
MSALHSDLARRIRRHLAESGGIAGQRLVEEDLCRRFDVSRTPVRGALRLLEREGIVIPRPGRGYVLAAPVEAANEATGATDDAPAQLFEAIAAARQAGELPDHISQQEIQRRFGASASVAARVLQESYAFRRALEPALLLLPGFRLDRDWARDSRATHLALRHKTWEPDDGRAFHALNADFHEQLARCCRNRYMRQAVEKQIALRRFLSRRWNYPVEQIHGAIDEHLEILAALEQGYADKASALMLHHLTKSATTSAAGAPQTNPHETGEALYAARKERNAG